MVDLEIDGKKMQVPQGSMIIEAADQAGIYIPRFCYHKKLSIAANCRMCLVEIEKVGKPLPACATPVTQDMKVFTQSKKALDSQRIVMEFLLINHPLDCPICDQGGECELQDLAMGYGSACSDYSQGKRSVASQDIGPLIETEMTRCIQCTRCVRFGEEVAGLRELGAVQRGEGMEISTYVQHFLTSELSGNIIDLCPVGALTAKPSRYQARAWEMREHASVAMHDCVGSNIYVHTRGQEYAPQRPVMRVVPKENDAINETWISDRDRFSYAGLNHAERALQPQAKVNGQWQTVTWQRALTEIADRVRAIAGQQGAEQLAALTSPNASTEECYLLQKLMRALGSNHIDHRLHTLDFSDQNSISECPDMGVTFAEVAELEVILLVGSNVRMEQPMLSCRINQAAQEGAVVMAVNPIDYAFTFKTSECLIRKDILPALAEILQALAQQGGHSVKELNHLKPGEQAVRIAQQLKQHDNSALFLGAFALDHPHAAQIRDFCRLIAELSNTKFGVLTEGANSAGAWLAGAVPCRGAAGARIEKKGKHARALLDTDPVRGYFLLNLEPELDCAYPEAAMRTLKAAGLVVCLSPFATPAMQSYADFILPIAPWTETAGTVVNAQGTWQSVAAVSEPQGDAKPAWKVLRALANFLELDGFDYKTVHQVRDALEQQVKAMPAYQPQPVMLQPLPANDTGLLRVGSWPMVGVDNIVRRAPALQATLTAAAKSIVINTVTAAALYLSDATKATAMQGESQVTLPLTIDDRLADGVVVVPSGLPETAGFGQAIAPVTLEKAS